MKGNQISNKKINVTQLEAAIRQLKTAIKLFFAEEDAFSIYTLTHNSLEIISKLIKNKGGKTMWEKIIKENIKPEYQKKLLKDAVEPRNFFKHGKTKKGGVSEENDSIEFYPETSNMFLLFSVDAVRTHFQKEFRSHAEFVVFLEWFTLHFPDCIKEEMRDKFFAKRKDADLTKIQFFQKNFSTAQSVLSSLSE